MSDRSEFVDPNTAVKNRQQLRSAADLPTWAARLQRFLASQDGQRRNVVISDMRVPGNGGSSGTLMFTAEYDDGHGHQRRELVLRYATDGGLFHAYNLPGQYAIMQGLQDSDVPVPGVTGLDADGHLLGEIAYLMTKVEGEAPPPSYHRLGLMLEATPSSRRKRVFAATAAQARLHARDWRRLGVEFLLTRGKGHTVIERDLDWLWTSLAWGCPADLDEVGPIGEWMLAHQPPEDYVCLCHGDSMLPNYMFLGDELSAIVDWELAFLGNPANDVAYQAFTHTFLGLGSPPLEGCPTIEERKAEYERVSGRRLEHWDYYYTMAAVKVLISMMLVFRQVPPEMEEAKRSSLDFIRQQIRDGQARGDKVG